jgi:quaternary ammonium compound-resistance protein SugE
MISRQLILVLNLNQVFVFDINRVNAARMTLSVFIHSGTAQFSRGVYMSWGILVLAGILEIVWAVGLKYTDGFSKFWPTLGTVLAMVLSVWLLGMAMKVLPVGTAYAIWVGIGAVGTAIFGIYLFDESASAGRIVSLSLIVAGIIGLKLSTTI